MIKCFATIVALILAWILGAITCATMDDFFKDHAESTILAFTIGFAIALLISIIIF